MLLLLLFVRLEKRTTVRFRPVRMIGVALFMIKIGLDIDSNVKAGRLSD